MYVRKDVRIRTYFSKPEVVHEQNSLGKTGLTIIRRSKLIATCRLCVLNVLTF